MELPLKHLYIVFSTMCSHDVLYQCQKQFVPNKCVSTLCVQCVSIVEKVILVYQQCTFFLVFHDTLLESIVIAICRRVRRVMNNVLCTTQFRLHNTIHIISSFQRHHTILLRITYMLKSSSFTISQYYYYYSYYSTTYLYISTYSVRISKSSDTPPYLSIP